MPQITVTVLRHQYTEHAIDAASEDAAWEVAMVYRSWRVGIRKTLKGYTALVEANEISDVAG